MFRFLLNAVVLAALCLVSATPVSAQTTLSEIGEANAARNELLENNGEAADAAAEEAAGEEPAGDEPSEAAPVAAPVGPPLDKWDDEHSIPRSRGPLVSWLKLTPLFLLLFFWIRTGDWINRDCDEFELGYETWSLVALIPGMIGGLLVLVLPMYVASLPILIACCVGPLAAYVVQHNKSVEQHQRVFTPDWFRFVMAEWLGKIGIKVKTDQQAGYMAGAAVELTASGPDERTQQANLLTARQSPGFVLVKDLVAEMVDRGSNRVLLDYTQQGVNVRHMIDGVWHKGEAQELETGNVVLAVMKQLANLDAKDRRSKQKGEFTAEYQGVKYSVPLQSQGVKTGERVVLSLAGGSQQSLDTYAELGMRSKVAEEWSAVMAETTGLVVFSSLPEGGLTSLMNVSLSETDRLMRDFIAIEDKASPEVEMENIEQVFFDRTTNESPATLMPRLIRKYPDVYVVRDFVDEASGKALLEQVGEGKLVITSVNARDAAEALVAVSQKAPEQEVAQNVIGSVSVKLIRKLCTDCRVGYEPSPALLQKLGIPAGKVEMLYREPKPEEAPKPCKTCGGIGFRGRTGLFEILLPDETVRESLLKRSKPERVRKAGRTAGMRSFQEEGILLVAKGATSLTELQRVLKT